MTNYTSLANSQNPSYTDWAAMGLSPDHGSNPWTKTKAAEVPALTRAEKNRIYAKKYWQEKKSKSALERNAEVTAFKKCFCSNFTIEANPSKPVPRATGAMRTSA